MSVQFRGTTICAVKRGGVTAIAGDGQVTMGEHTVFKTHARKIRRIYGGEVLLGFAGLDEQGIEDGLRALAKAWL